MKIACFFTCFLFIFFIQSCSSKKKPDCSKLKLGTFNYTNTITGTKYKIVRRQTTQIETNLVTGEVIKKGIKWLSDCEYELYKLAKLVNDSIEIDNNISLEYLDVRISIIGVTKEYYLFTLSDNLNKTYDIDTMRIEGLVGGFKSMSNIFK